ncbi:imidazolonepropionase [Permianibacter sp. IMCC34836]|uniref:imidazolonepropionase n=1 Tax=Permianibacter fluminis TaxID=2738515 RepID=UPI001557C734|nr:imidazolonepropionase [Permianibacter fluminis]NQD38798.1 imidazolonepropionase [Permianibacter fluminis]
MTSTEQLFVNCTVCTMAGDDYGLIPDAAIWVRKDRIAWIGARRDCPVNSSHRIDLQGALVTPGLVDCHTHLVYAGHRGNEFEARLNGASYADIAKAGGGIMSTVKASRAASEDSLFALAATRANRLMREGVTTVEIKSGYGLDQDSELKLLRVATRLGRELPLTVQRTFLGAHALPPEFAGRPDDYIDFLCQTLLPLVVSEQLADAVDVFCEGIGFNLEQSRKMLVAAKAAGLAIKIHAEQLSDLKGARLAAALGALSVDHIEYLDPADVPALTGSGTAAVLLPGAFYYLRETKLPPIASLREHGVPMALATDSNPGTSPTHSLLLMLNMACTLFRLTPLEALRGITVNGARALGMAAEIGTLELNKRADFAVFAIDHPAELSYRFGDNPCVGRCAGGEYQSYR